MYRPVQFANVPADCFQMTGFVGRIAVCAPVMPVSVLEVSQQYLVHRDVVRPDDSRGGDAFEFELQPSECDAGLSRVERTGEEFLFAATRLVGPDCAGSPGLFVE